MVSEFGSSSFLCWQRGFNPSDSKSPKHFFFTSTVSFICFLENHRVGFLFHADKYIIVVVRTVLSMTGR